MTHTPYKTLRAKSASGNVAKAHLIHDDPSYPNGMYGVAHVYGDSDEQANQMAQDLATRYNAHDDLVAALVDIERSLNFSTNGGKSRNKFRDTECELLKVAQAALRKARGEA